jgi:hypothetical protein
MDLDVELSFGMFTCGEFPDVAAVFKNNIVSISSNTARNP